MRPFRYRLSRPDAHLTTNQSERFRSCYPVVGLIGLSGGLIGVHAATSGANRRRSSADRFVDYCNRPGHGGSVTNEPIDKPDYVIATRWLGCDHTIPLAPDEYRAARHAKDLLLATLAIEEGYDIVALNFGAFETAIFSAKIDTILDRRRERDEIEDLRRELDRHLVNLMASGEMFLAHANGFLTSAARRGYAVDKDLLVTRRADLETELPAFAAMKWLRNATLHEKLPISNWSYGGSWTDGAKGPDAKRQHSFSIALDRELVRRVRDLPGHLKEELEGRADAKGRIAWRDLVREYVEGLSRLNVALRDALTSGESAARVLLECHVARFRARFGGERPISVEAVKRGRDGTWLESFSLEFDYARRIDSLRRKNTALVNLRKVEILD